MMESKLRTGTILRGTLFHYRVEKVLGQGSFGITYLARIVLDETHLAQLIKRGKLFRTTRNGYRGYDVVGINGTPVFLPTPGVTDDCMYVAVKEFFMKDINGRVDTKVTCGSNAEGGVYDNYKRKFIREAYKLGKLNHPDIVKVIEAFESNQTAYYTMEYVEGGNLNDYIEQGGGLSERDTLMYVKQICGALSYMHKEKMLHLDLKPSNMMIRRNGRIVLIDFGLSKSYDEKGIPESSTTIGGGTPGYAPLEQAHYKEGRDFPTTMDVYALGATMFKMFTGIRPLEASVLLNEGFPKGELSGRCSVHIISCIEKAMSPLKKDRYGSISEMLKDLDSTETTATSEEETIMNNSQDEMSKEKSVNQSSQPKSSTQSKPSKKKRRKGWYIVFLILLLIAGGGCLVWLYAIYGV